MATVVVTFTDGSHRRFKTLSVALGYLSGRFGRPVTLEPQMTFYTADDRVVTWYLLYAGRNTVGSLYEGASDAVRDCIEELEDVTLGVMQD
jgi:hypothetical protein